MSKGWQTGIKLFGVLAGALVLLLASAVAALWWWAGTGHSLQWALGQLAARTPVVVEQAQGTLRSGVQAKRLVWEQDGLRAEATDVQLAWQPLSLLHGTLKLDHLRAASVQVQDRRPASAEPAKPPASLALLVRVAVDEVAVGRFEWNGKATVQAQQLTARYVFDGFQHRLGLRSLQMLGGSYRGDIRLGARGDMPLVATLEGRLEAPVPAGRQKLPLVFNAALEGPLADLQARVQAQAGGTQGTRATVTARVTPWAAQPVPQAHAQLQDFDLAALWPQAPSTRLAGEVRVQPAGTASWTLSADLRNAMAGPWDRERLPIEQLKGEGEWRQAGQALVRSLQAQLGGGRVEASGQWQGERGWVVNGTLAGINPAALHSTMASVPVSGRASVRGEGQAIDFETELRAAGNGRPRGKPGSAMAATVGALELRQLIARGRWSGERLTVPQLQVRTADAALDGALEFTPATRAASGQLSLQAPGLQGRAEGSLAQASGKGTLRLASANLAAAQAWLQRLPGMPAALRDRSVAGRAELQAAWQGGWQDPALQASLAAPVIELLPAAGQEGGWTLRDTNSRLDGRLADARLQLRGTAQSGPRRANLDLTAQGGRRDAASDVWQARVQGLNLGFTDPSVGQGTWVLALRRAFDVRWAAGTLDTGASEAVLTAPRAIVGGAPSQAVLAWDPLRWGGGELRTAGRLTGLPMEWIELVGGPQLAGSALAGDMLFDAQWDAAFGAGLRLRASLARTGGDITVLAENAEGGSARVRAGVRDARLVLESEGEALTLSLRWDSERAGTAEGRVQTRLARGGDTGWHWPQDAPLSGNVRAQLPRIGVWSLLAPPGWRLRGSLGADISIAGTRADPALGGTLRADDVALRSVVDGVELQGGRLRARLDGRRLLVDEFVLRGGGGPGGGSLSASGEGSWPSSGPQVRVTAQLDRLRASARTDRQLTVSGNVAAALDSRGGSVTGTLRVDQARIVVPDETAPKLGSDVVVRNAPGSAPIGQRPRTQVAGAAGSRRRVAMDVALDLGNDFRVQGRGIDTRLTGVLTLAGESVTAPRLTGTLNTAGGEYRAYGQRLDIERGVLRFTGPIDNPALDILAIRPRMVQRVGVLVTGRALSPFVRLYAEPELPEAEKLSWLVLGRASASGGAEAALVQQAAAALLASRTGGGGRGPAALLGLDELSFRRDGADGPAVTLGKRFGQNLYAAYERSLSGALGTLYVFYDLSRRFTVRAQTGERSAVDLIFTFSYD